MVLLLGTPIDPKGGNFLPENVPPPQFAPQNKNPWHPFESRPHFELADFIFHQNKMPGEQINELMHIWASMSKHNDPPPFFGSEDVYGSIDAVSEGDAPWTSLLMESAEATTSTDDPHCKHQYFMTKHCKKIEERDTLLFTILFNKKDKYHTASFSSFFVSKHDLRSFIMLGL